MGRKTTYNQPAADEIIRDLSKGTPLAEICRREGLPAASTVYDWIREHQEFAVRFARARADGFDAIAADCLKIADDASGDVIETEHGPKLNAEFAARSRIRIETRLKLLAKWDPKRYGERIAIEEEVTRRTLSRADAMALMQSGAVTIDQLMDRWTKPVEAIEAPKSEETAQESDDSDIAGLID